MSQVFVTRKGMDLLNQKLQEAIEKLKHTQGQKAEAHDVGGDCWHDNFAFEELTRQEMMFNKQIADIRDLQKRQVLVSSPTDDLHVQIGHVISLEDEDGLIREFQVAGYGETDLRSHPPALEYGAPIIFPFMGAEIGTEAQVQIRGEQVFLVLVAIRRGDENVHCT